MFINITVSSNTLQLKIGRTYFKGFPQNKELFSTILYVQEFKENQDLNSKE